MLALKPFLISLAAILVLNGLWLGVMKKFYRRELGKYLRTTVTGKMDPVLWAAALVYLLLAAGLTVFVLPMNSPLFGAIFGVVVYGVYDFTNLSLLKNWSIKAVAVDIVWGGALSAAVTAITLHFLA